MRKHLLLLGLILSATLLFNSSATSQIHIEIHTVDALTKETIYGIQCSLISNNEGRNILYGGYRNVTVNKDQLHDTLVIEHPKFTFENRPLVAYHHEIVDGCCLRVTIFGYPKKPEEFFINASTARSKKIKNDSIEFKAAYSGENHSLSFAKFNGDLLFHLDTLSNELYATHHQRVAYDDLQDGFIESSGPIDENPSYFRKENWTELQVMNENNYELAREREVDMIVAYFNTHEKLRNEISELRYSHQEEKNKLYHEIDSLKTKIDELMGVPDPTVDMSYVPEEVYPEAQIIDFPNVDATPVGGFNDYWKKVEGITNDVELKYGGNITIELIVKRYNGAIVNVLHASPDKQALIDALSPFLSKFPWNPAEYRGRKVDTRFIIKIEIAQK